MRLSWLTSVRSHSKLTFLRLVNQKVDRLSANRHIRPGAEGDEQIHLCSKIHIAARFGSHCRMIHAAGHAVDFHVLIEVEWIGYIFRIDAVRRQSPRKILVTAMIRNLFVLIVSVVIVSQLSLFFGELKAVAAAHAFLQILSSLAIGVLDD